MYTILHGLAADYLNGALARNAATAATGYRGYWRSAIGEYRNTARCTGAERNGRQKQLCGGRPNHVEQLAKVCELSENNKKNSPISLTLPALMTLISIL